MRRRLFPAPFFNCVIFLLASFYQGDRVQGFFAACVSQFLVEFVKDLFHRAVYNHEWIDSLVLEHEGQGIMGFILRLDWVGPQQTQARTENLDTLLL